MSVVDRHVVLADVDPNSEHVASSKMKILIESATSFPSGQTSILRLNVDIFKTAFQSTCDASSSYNNQKILYKAAEDVTGRYYQEIAKQSARIPPYALVQQKHEICSLLIHCILRGIVAVY